MDFGFIIFTILSTTPRNKDAAESALPTIAPFLAATRSASAFARWLVTGLMVGRDGAAPSWIGNKPPCSHGMALLRNGTMAILSFLVHYTLYLTKKGAQSKRL